MRTSKYILYTLKEKPHHTDTISHQLMLKAGLIRQLASGLYIWLPNGLKIIQNIQKIIRKEMNQCGAIEISFPIMQPDTLWIKSNRLQEYGKELMKIYDRKNHCFILSPTYEEIITDFIKKEITSYKKLPIILYQIQIKFRDEIRPRSGTIRSREFIMKDAYSFHNDKNSLKKIYKKIYQVYISIFNKMNLKFYSVEANSGIMGGKYSHEFQALSNNGEDKIIISRYLNNPIHKNNLSKFKKIKKIKIFYKKKYIYPDHINCHKTEMIIKNFFSIRNKIIKIFIFKNNDNQNKIFDIFFIRGDHELDMNTIYFKKNKCTFANQKEILNNITDIKKNINLLFPITIDIDVAKMNHIIPIVIINNQYFKNNILNQDFTCAKIKDIKYINNRKYISTIHNSIEIGHIFQIGKKYSKIINAKVQNQKGIKKFLHMGCYGIGITRIISAIIEQNHDKKGIIWPNNIAPFQVLIIPIQINKFQEIKNISEKLYNKFKLENITVLLEDRNVSIGIKFSDANLIGIPNIIIINYNTINNNTIEYQERKNMEKKILINLKNIIPYIKNKIKKNK